MNLGSVILVLETLGVIAFAFSGAILAIKKSMDILGVVVLAVTTAVGGGIIRDVILGINPPMAFRHSTQTLTAAVVAVIIFIGVAYCQSRGIRNLFKKLDIFMTVFDAGTTLLTYGDKTIDVGKPFERLTMTAGNPARRMSTRRRCRYPYRKSLPGRRKAHQGQGRQGRESCKGRLHESRGRGRVHRLIFVFVSCRVLRGKNKEKLRRKKK